MVDGNLQVGFIHRASFSCFVAVFCFIASMSVTADVLDGGIVIPPKDIRWPIIQSIPLKNEVHAKTTSVKIREQGGQCYLRVGGLPEQPLEMPAPCDIQTHGAMNSFRPNVHFVSMPGTPDEIWFEIVGALRYYPSIRSECSRIKRTVAIRWQRINGKLGPYLDLGPVSDDIRGARCPRSFVEVKGPLIYGIDMPQEPPQDPCVSNKPEN